MNISSISNQSISRYYEQLSSGKRINSAADDAAGLAISEKLLSQSNGYDVGLDNAASSKNMINVADGALASINDSLQRIRELGLQASNAIYSDSDREAIQMEIDQLKQGINDVATQTEFNTIKLLDGSKGSFNVAAGPDGSGMSIDMPESTLAALGIEDFDVTGDFDISAIDEALSKVSEARSGLGATSNRLDNVMNYNANASYNLVGANSNIEDLDYPKAISEKEKERVLQEYRLMMMKRQQEEEAKVLGLFQ